MSSVLQCFPLSYSAKGPLTPEWFATVSADNRLKTWSTSSGELINTFTDEDHLENVYTALDAVHVSAQKKKGGTKATKQKTLVALGTDSGSIVVWRTDLGEVTCRLEGEDGHIGKVTSVKFNRQGTLLYSAGEDKMIREWSLADGSLTSTMKNEKTGVACLCLHPDGSRLLSAMTSIQLWDLSTHKVIKKFTGHTSTVSCLAFSKDASYFISGAADRFVSVWSTKPSKKKRDKTCVQSFTLDSPPVSLEFNRNGKASNVVEVCGVSSTGKGFVWRWNTDKASPTEPITVPDCLISTPAAPPVPEKGKKKRKRQAPPPQPGLAQLTFLQDRSLMGARDGDVKPAFHVLSYVDEEGSLIEALGLPLLSLSRLLPENQKEQEAKAHTPAVHIAENASSENVRQQLAGGERKSKRSRRNTKNEATIEELVVDADTGNAGLLDDARKAGSLQTVLSQALHTNDVSLVGYCLRQGAGDDDVIARTVDRLPLSSILPLLTAVVSRYRTKPSRGVYLLKWIQRILSTHTSYLMTIPELSGKLATLYNTVNQRLSVFHKLLTLNGRLDLVLHQVHKSSGSSEQTGSGGPLSLFDPDEDNSDSELDENEGDDEGDDNVEYDDEEEEEESDEESDEDY